ncbi:MAG: glutathione peroxidase [Pseudomonadota bacterium]
MPISLDFRRLGGDIALAHYRGKAVLVVNTASFCGFTPQYTALQALWIERRDQGLVVLGVPSGDFGGQEYETEAEIKDFCDVNFDVDFPMTTREKVSGADAHPFYQWARAELGEDQSPKWNFHKYLVGPDGNLVASFATRVTPDDQAIRDAIDIALSRP